MNVISQSNVCSELRELIDAALRRSVEFDAGCPSRLREAVEYSLLAPGKRLRPQLVLMAAQACGGEAGDALPAAVAVEMIHAYSLVHDDLPAMDDDDLRRGRPTCHNQFDEATAILVGDALLARAFEVLATEIKPAQRAARCCAELANAAGATALVGGQADDLAAQYVENGSGGGALDRLESIHRRKTGALFRVAVRMGGLLAQATDGQLQALDTYGQHLGLAFQLGDDLLDVLGSEGEVGKRLGKDSGRGKTTYPAVLGVADCQARLELLVAAACQALESFGEAAGALREVALFIGKRTN
ncbi:MAG: polyprenyl synthetase family protein [Pirellulales bacterium]|nr:polyprenyl synthetase family protein [Pirellulales bacterium]